MERDVGGTSEMNKVGKNENGGSKNESSATRNPISVEALEWKLTATKISQD